MFYLYIHLDIARHSKIFPFCKIIAPSSESSSDLCPEAAEFTRVFFSSEETHIVPEGIDLIDEDQSKNVGSDKV